MSAFNIIKNLSILIKKIKKKKNRIETQNKHEFRSNYILNMNTTQKI